MAVDVAHRWWLHGLIVALLTACATTPPPAVATDPPATPAIPDEVAPPQPSPAHVWVPGHWAWRKRNYVWVTGHWTIPGKKTEVWEPGHWEMRGSRYEWVEGRWRTQ